MTVEAKSKQRLSRVMDDGKISIRYSATACYLVSVCSCVHLRSDLQWKGKRYIGGNDFLIFAGRRAVLGFVNPYSKSGAARCAPVGHDFSPIQSTTMNSAVRRVAAAGARRARLPLGTTQTAHRTYATVTAAPGDAVEDFVSKADSKQVETRIDLVR